MFSTSRSDVDGAHRSAGRRQQHLDRFGADASADQSAPIFRAGKDVGVQVVHLRDVAAGALQEDDHAVLAHGTSNRLFHVIDPVGGNAAGVAGAVAGVVYEAADALPLAIPGGEHAHLRIDRPGGLNDVGVELAGMGKRQAVLHAEAAVEGHLVLDSLADATAGFRPRRSAAQIAATSCFSTRRQYLGSALVDFS